MEKEENRWHKTDKRCKKCNKKNVLYKEWIIDGTADYKYRCLDCGFEWIVEYINA